MTSNYLMKDQSHYRIAQILLFILFIIQTFRFPTSKKRYDNSFIILFSVIMSSFYLFSQFMNSTGYYFGFFYCYFFSGFAIFLVREEVNLKTIRLFFYLISVYLISLFLRGIPTQLWALYSENHISIFILFFGIFIIALTYKQKEEVYISDLILIFIICVMANGRSGIASSVFLLIFLGLKYNLKKMIPLLCISLILTIYFLDFILNNIFREFAFEGAKSFERLFIMYEYFDRIDLATFFTGIPYQSFDNLKSYNLAFHNSYISIHSEYGIGLLFLLAVILALLITSKERYFYGIILVVILFRSYTDSILITNGLFMGALLFYVLNEMYFTSFNYKHQILK